MRDLIPEIKLRAGHPEPRGAHFDGKGVNFAVFSAHAEKIELCLFDASGKTEIDRIELTGKTDDVFHAYIEGLKPGQIYGFRVHGPHAPHEGHYFIPEKIMLDPYAKDIIPPTDHEAPKARVPNTDFDWQGTKPPNTAWSKTLIYEAHPKGLTKTHPDIADEARGFYKGLADPKMIKHYKDHGITAVELLPVHAHTDENHLKQKGKTNYWGYNTIGFFAPEPSYAQKPENALREFKETVRELHRHGIEVILDVVYNHTGEESPTGPTMFLRGIDNKSYYRLSPEDNSQYYDVTGCGNSLDFSHPETRKMVLDSLRYWVRECGIDGFRFDLAPVLGRDHNGFNTAAPLFEDIAKDPLLSKIKLIAEPWDVGPDGYQLGNFPAGWKEWNDKFRDTLRSYWRGDDGKAGALAHAMSGSSDPFDKPGRSPQDSINFLSAHDGFTLEDTVSYNDKHNEANGEDNRDGHGHNLSANYGAEGPTDNPDIIAHREQQKRNMLASLFLAQGTPMLLAGDEIGNSQQGNNNAYCQDNETSWLNWHKTKPKDSRLQKFVARLQDFRARHPILNAPYFMHGQKRDQQNIPDISWHGPGGHPIKSQNWPHAKTFAMMLHEPAADPVRGKNSLLVAFNAAAKDKELILPKLPEGRWMRVLDTATPDLQDGQDQKPYQTYAMKAHSLTVFKSR